MLTLKENNTGARREREREENAPLSLLSSFFSWLSSSTTSSYWSHTSLRRRRQRQVYSAEKISNSAESQKTDSWASRVATPQASEALPSRSLVPSFVVSP